MIKKKYSNVFAQAKNDPNYRGCLQEATARLKLAELLHKERTFQSLSMAQLAKKAGTTPAVISRIENAQVSAGIDLIYKIFKALGKKTLNLDLS